MTRTERTAGLAVPAAVACLLMSASAAAGAGSIATKIDAGWDGDNHYIDGYVITKRTPEGFECARGRKIVVKYLKTGKVVGSGKTKSEGKRVGSFRINLGRFAPKGRYRVVAKARTIGETVCERGATTLTQRYDEND
jgi:hypothetical protein